MKIKRKLFTSFMARFKGNTELKDSLIVWSRNKKVDKSIFKDCDEFSKYNKTVQSYLTWLEENLLSTDEPVNFSGVRLVLISYNKILDRVLKGKKSFFGEKMPKDPRVVIGWVDAGNSVIVLSYDIKKNKIVLNKEHLNYQILSRGIDKLFNYKEEVIIDPDLLFDTIINISKFIK